MLDGKRLLVTGGTGSFGRKLIGRVLEDYDPKEVIVFSRDELKQHDMAQQFGDERISYVLGDVRDAARVEQAMEGCDIVVHAAALKQVPAAEANPMEVVKTNVGGAENIINGALKNKIEKVIAMSTDKAAMPINLYGATKLTSDKLMVSANNLPSNDHTFISVVRYGNVMNSRGSVIPFWKDIIANGGTSLPITDVRMTRFNIMLSEGVQFVLDCLERMHGGEIFVPKIPSYRLVDLAEALAPGYDTKFVGIRPGEKLHELMVPAPDSHLTLEFGDHYVIQPTIKFKYRLDVAFSMNKLGELGEPVEDGFEYSSGANPEFIDPIGLRQILEEEGIR